jgi:two-component system, NarL family, nitrate/nitrite response regulator NarL
LEVAEKFPGTPVVIVSGSTRRDDIHGAIKLGAKGFIPKTMRPREFVEAIDIIMSGGTFIPQIDSASGTVTRATPQTTAVSSAMQDTALKSLTPREREVLGHLIKGLPNKKIADEMALQEITIRVHLQNVYRKLGVSNRAHAVATALNGGWSDLCVA